MLALTTSGMARACAAIVLCVGAGSVLAQNAPVSPFAGTPQKSVLQEDEARIWDEAADSEKGLRRRGSYFADAKLDAYLQGLIDDLFPEFQGAMRIRAVNDPDLNAFAMPHGALFINLGLIARLENEAQLAAVLAHEGAHFIYRHGYQHRQSAKATSAFALSIGLVGGIVGALGQIAAVSSIYGFSREHEREADRVGFERMVAKGYDTTSGMRVFEILRDESKILEYKEPFMFASHPKLDERVDSFRELRANNPAAQAMSRTEEERFLQVTNGARIAWLDQAFAFSRYKSVIHVLEKADAARRYPRHYQYYLGEAYRLRNDKEDLAKAQQAYEAALKTAPDYAPTYKAMATLSLADGKREQARSLFEKYLGMQPDAADGAFIKTYIQQIQ